MATSSFNMVQVHQRRRRLIVALVTFAVVVPVGVWATRTLIGGEARAERLLVSVVPSPSGPVREVPVEAASALTDVVEATRRLGLTILPTEGNAVVSPSSLAVALSMLTEGARGQTLAELEGALGAVGSDRLDAVVALRSALAPFAGDPAVVQADDLPANPVVHLATQIFIDDQLTAEPDYVSTLQQNFGTGVGELDLGTAAATPVLDAWVRQNSGGLIEHSGIVPDPTLRLVIQDAIVLAARCASPFGESSTSDQPFNLADGRVVQVPTMLQLFAAQTAEVDGWQAVRLPYTGETLHADLLLPPLGVDPGAVSVELLAQLNAAITAAPLEQVVLQVPKLNLQPGALNLIPALQRLGLSDVLNSSRADLTGIGVSDDGLPLFLGQAWQQAVFQFDEQGTRAAAVTELGLMAGSAPVQPALELVFDRPFLIIVAPTDTSWPLFMVAARDPSQN